jgi:hypothetical protein
VVGDDPALRCTNSIPWINKKSFASPDKFVVVREVDRDLYKIPWDQLCERKGRTYRTGTVQGMDENEIAVNLTNLNAMSLSRFIAISELFWKTKPAGAEICLFKR